MKSVSCRAFILVVAAVVIVSACGRTPSEAERAYAEACIKLLKGSEVYRRLCECEAGVMVSKLTPGELKAYIASPDLLGKPMTPESAARLGFTIDEFRSLGEKQYAAAKEVLRCAH
jgi:hypothetical protein